MSQGQQGATTSVRRQRWPHPQSPLMPLPKEDAALSSDTAVWLCSFLNCVILGGHTGQTLLQVTFLSVSLSAWLGSRASGFSQCRRFLTDARTSACPSHCRWTLGLFPFGAIVNTAALDICMQVPWQTRAHSSAGCSPRSGRT